LNLKTLEAVRESAKKLVEEKGYDFVYTKPNIRPSHVTGRNDLSGCYYVHDFGNGSVAACIAAQILNRDFEFSIDMLMKAEGTGAPDILSDHHFELDAEKYMGILQSLQDDGHSWGFALKRAELWISEGKSTWWTKYTSVNSEDNERA
jgi:hypothetical protein